LIEMNRASNYNSSDKSDKKIRFRQVWVMHILLTNDDGIFAPGLAAIYKKLIRLGKVSVVAPAEGKSGASHSITLEPLMCDKVDLTGKFAGYSVSGSPADCVKLGIMELTAEPIDLVVSGMNHGANVGVNVYYSGTVAAAMEAAFFSIPSVALSVAYEEDTDFDAAAEYGLGVIEKLLPLGPGSVININVPMLSKGKPTYELKGCHHLGTAKQVWPWHPSEASLDRIHSSATAKR
jgi:5'-nucleotidase